MRSRPGTVIYSNHGPNLLQTMLRSATQPAVTGPLGRRQILRVLASTAAGWTLSTLPEWESRDAIDAVNLHLAPFRFDVTPPIGHACCGGWIKPIEGIDDPLEAIGIVLLGVGEPIVLCAVDWTGLLNEAHVAWREALAAGSGTTADRVAVHCVHQHNAPMACLEAERIVAAQRDLPHILDVAFFQGCLERAEQSVRQAIRGARRVTHVATGEARVDSVASNRRVSRDSDGRVKAMRGSSCRDAELRALPEGLIDPMLKTIAFYEETRKLAALHYYATHPMSYYGDGRASSDFAGLARKQRQQDEPDCTHVYFTGCAGNIAAGKYNDGSRDMRQQLTGRLYDAIVNSERELQSTPIESMGWKSLAIVPPPLDTLSADAIEHQIADTSAPVVNRNRPSFQLAWLRRLQRGTPIIVSALHLDTVRSIHLPAECFVEYQLRAQQLHDGFSAVAAYGDGGPWYIPTRDEYANGGYEVSVAFSSPDIDKLLSGAIARLC